MACKSNKYFGYTSKYIGSPFQSMVFSEIPTQQITVVNSTSTAEVASGGVIPTTNILFDQSGCDIVSSGYIVLSKGLYKIDVNMEVSTAAAGQVTVDLKKNGTTVASGITNTAANSAGDFVGTISFSTVQNACDCNDPWTLVNDSAVAITPVINNISSVQIIITRIA